MIREYRTIDKSKWIPGPWLQEPDKVQWRDEATGLPCLIRRGHHGGWCGYVGLAEDHALYGKDYEEPDVRVHGGLTFSDKCSAGEDERTGICHVPEAGEPEHVWWFGFDCAHAGDLIPGYQHLLGERYSGLGWEEYCGMAYVKAETTSLAKQLAAL